jgi:hypothetical protein
MLNHLRQAESWRKLLCQLPLQEGGVDPPDGPGGRRVRPPDGTLVKEPGRTGSQWRIHYSPRVPSLLCGYLDIPATHGQGTGETPHRFPAHPGDLVLGDRGFCSPAGIAALKRQGADVLVRWHGSREAPGPDGALAETRRQPRASLGLRQTAAGLSRPEDHPHRPLYFPLGLPAAGRSPTSVTGVNSPS